MKLSGVMLGSENPKHLGNFYTGVFGDPVWQDGDWYVFKIGDGNLMIGSHSEVKGSNTSPARIMICVDSDDVKADFEKIKNQGTTVVAEPYQPNKEKSDDVWLATLSDPDGNYFQLMTPYKD